MDLSHLSYSGVPLRDAPLGSLDRLILMGQNENVEAALRYAGEQPDAVYLPRTQALTFRPRTPVARHLTAAVRTQVPGASAKELREAFAQTSAFFGLGLPRRATMAQLTQPDRFYLAALFAAARAAGAQFAVADNPLGTLSGGARSSLRSRLLEAAQTFGLGLVVSTANPVDAGLLGGEVVVLEKDQIADRGSLGAQLTAPRSNLAAQLARVNVFSGLARRGWVSIGHSQVKARTELDGKVFATIPYDAATLSLDEFDPQFGHGVVFEALVTQVVDAGERVDVSLSPADTEVGLIMRATLWDFSAQADLSEPAAWGVRHRGLGPNLRAQRDAVHAGTRLFVQVDTEQMRAYPVEHAAPAAASANQSA